MARDKLTPQRIADDLRAAIRAGELPAGARLPSYAELMERYETSSATAGKALDLLRADGLIVSRRGAGAFVRSDLSIVREIPRHAEAEPALYATDMRVVLGPVPSSVAEAFGESGTAQAAVMRSWRTMTGDRPVELVESFIPSEIAYGTVLTAPDPGDLYVRLGELGYAVTRFFDLIKTRAAGDEEAKALGLPKGARVLEVTRQSFREDQCVEVRRMVLDGSVFAVGVHHYPA